MNTKNAQFKKSEKKLDEKSPKILKKLERILEYGPEFEKVICQELELIRNDATPPSNPVPATKKSIFLSATILEKSGAEIMENVFETTFLQDSNLILMDPSFDFRLQLNNNNDHSLAFFKIYTII